MKKYLNNNLFYQGDANIFLLLCIVYVASFMVTLIITDGYFNWEIKYYIYNQEDVRFIFSDEGVLSLIAYISIVYSITVGIFKRKKWSTLLSGPFSRRDIRIRELIIVVISVIIYIAIFLSVILKYYIQYYDLLIYIDNFPKTVILDVVRIISMSVLGIGVLAILDSIFSNLYYLVGAVIVSLIYLVFLTYDFSPILSYHFFDKVYGLTYVYNGLIEYLSGSTIGNSISILQIVGMSGFFIFIGIVLLYISKILTNKMLVENMNEGIILEFPKKVASFMLITSGGIVSAPYISNLIDDIYFKYSLGEYQLVVIRFVIIIVVSMISYFAFKSFKKVKKDEYY
ncbi:hypothetical protein R0131_04045 [Clostridium sp. AL.422]|uniref:hypothetical protein n=1 Tax=Clostridium TaxID=1485 RepID=UPI00293DBA92|nr:MULTISPECIES: hypothetical protein [unclassified Clostridium]MDV4150001.1 hypothetical protein [Clostridium sp. AL.422]